MIDSLSDPLFQNVEHSSQDLTVLDNGRTVLHKTVIRNPLTTKRAIDVDPDDLEDNSEELKWTKLSQRLLRRIKKNNKI